jgi:hypothetical protein
MPHLHGGRLQGCRYTDRSPRFDRLHLHRHASEEYWKKQVLATVKEEGCSVDRLDVYARMSDMMFRSTVGVAPDCVFGV